MYIQKVIFFTEENWNRLKITYESESIGRISIIHPEIQIKPI